MLVTPSNIKLNKILRDRTINFETPTRTHGNMVIIPTIDRDAFVSTIKGNLFRPMQLLAIYTPRKVKPIGRSATIINQKDYYSEMRVATGGRIKKGKTVISAYGGQNLIYDIYNEYNITRDILINRGFTRQRLQRECINTLTSLINTAASDSDYKDVYLVLPITKPFENFQRVIMGNEFETSDPIELFIQGFINDTLDKTVFDKIKKVIFYVPKGNVMLTIDLKDPDVRKEIPNIQAKLRRLNSFVAGEDTLDDEFSEDEQTIEITKEDKVENTKEEIKKIVLTKIAKIIHANNLTDFEAASRDERDLMVIIDNKIETYLKKPENLKKSINDMVDEIEADNDVKSKAIRYVETKKGAILRADTLAKGLEKESEIIGSLQDLDDDSDENTPEAFDVQMKYVDDRIKKSHLASLDEQYNKKQAMTDLTNVISAFSNSEYSPMTVDSVSFEETSTDQDEKRTAHVRYKTDDGKTLSFQLDIPKIVDKRYLYLGGNKKVIKKQLIRLPIVKTKSDRVEITTNYNKMTLERTNGKLSRKNAYLLKKLKDMKENPGFEIEYGDNSVVNAKLGYSNDFEYEELAANINKIKSGKYFLLFNRDAIGEEIDTLDIPEEFITPDKTPLGFEKVGDEFKSLIFIKENKIYKYDISAKVENEISPSLFEFLTNDVLKLDMSSLPSIGKSFIYTKVKFLQTTYPVLAIVASQKGLTNILERYNVEYYKTEKQQRKNLEYVEVKFKDCYLYYKDEIKNTLLLNSLYMMNTQDYNYADFDSDLPYTQYFIDLLGESVGIHTRNTLKINLAVVIDPITRDVLRDLKLPTDIIDVLLYANTLLVGNQYKPQNDMTNYRVRSNELIADIMYGMIADAYVSYCKHKINGRALNLTVPKGALISKLQQEPNINDKSTLNPIIEAEQIAQASAKGYRGVNINDAYTLEMRAYDKSMDGIISGNSTPYSGQAGITRSLSYDPNITTVRGYIPQNNGEKWSATNMLSPTELLSAFTAAGADAPRQAMQVAQTGHTMPIAKSSKQLIGSGMNKTLAFMISDDFCFKAKKAGFVEKIDSVNKVAILKYDDGTKDAIDLADKLNKNSGMGFYIHQLFQMAYSEKEHFEAGDVIAFNPNYFSGKGKDVDYHPGALAKIAIASGDFSFEDSTMIAESLGEKCASKINMLKQTAFGKNAVIHKLVDIGATVTTGDSLIEFTTSFEDEDTSEFLQKLADTLSDDQLNEITHEMVKAKYSGEITNVEIFYNCPFEELSESLQKIITKYKKRLENRAKAIEGIDTGSVHVPPLTQVTSKKIGKQEFPPEGGVIINIYTEYLDTLAMGDKLTYSTALKGVVSRVLSNDEAPLCDWRPEEHIEAILTPTGIISRMTSDIYSLTFANKVLIECGKQIREIWNNER